MTSDGSSIENRLRNRPVGEPSTEFRRRVLDAIDGELSATRSIRLPARKKGGFPAFAGAMAALLLVGLNLAIAAASATPIEGRSQLTRQQIQRDALEIERAAPDLAPAEAWRAAVLLHAGQDIRALPVPSR